MNCLFAYGHTIQSEIFLCLPKGNKTPPDIHIKSGGVDRATVSNHEVSRTILTEKTGAASYLIQNGQSITVDSIINADLDLLQANILGGCMAILLKQRGYFILHASCLPINQGAIAFVGNSGQGKSTLAAYFSTLGYPLITDDILTLTLSQSHPKTISSYPYIKLSPEAALAIGQPPQYLTPLHKNSQKLIYPLRKKFTNHSYPLKHIYLLATGNEVEIITASPQQAFRNLMIGSDLKTNNAPIREKQKHMEDCVRLLQTVPVSILRRPRSLCLLPQTATAIINHQNNLNANSIS